MCEKKSILLIYTGGTIGMVVDNLTGSLVPFDFDQIVKQVPELNMFDYVIDSVTFDPLIDSSNVEPKLWKELAGIISKNYNDYCGFVILHGTDTMSYTASALSFMLQNLDKPVVLTGSQLPIGKIRTDGKENLITAVEIAAAYDENNNALVPEVSIIFQDSLYRGNRTTKSDSENFDAFHSYNYPSLAKVGININYNRKNISYPSEKQDFFIEDKLDNNIAILKMFPGISKNTIEAVLNIPDLKGVIIETYGAGNAPTHKWLLELISKAIERGILVMNVTQCAAGKVEMGLYETSRELLEMGVVCGKDITTEAAVAKMMYVLGKEMDYEQSVFTLNKPLKGEISA
ncbi:MAG: asparaginase [Marinifilaceae bacterium]|jgi:L-asparaginase|nr:asparaginase [Marinifilaceae bacterium]